MSTNPMTSWGSRACFFPYKNVTRPMELMNNEARSPFASTSSRIVHRRYGDDARRRPREIQSSVGLGVRRARARLPHDGKKSRLVERLPQKQMVPATQPQLTRAFEGLRYFEDPFDARVGAHDGNWRTAKFRR